MIEPTVQAWPLLASVALLGGHLESSPGPLIWTRFRQTQIRTARSKGRATDCLVAPFALGGIESALPAARRLYLAEAEVVRALEAKAPLPDREVTPAGALV
jgi:hypothetical protein